MNAKELILTHILKCSRADLYINPVVLSESQEKLFNEINKRLDAGEPLQYILGECEFYGLTFKVDQNVLIPRPETELLVEKIIEQIDKDRNFKSEIFGLDIGTGSGNISIALVKSITQLQMCALDVSQAALKVAQENARSNGVSDRVEFICDDVFSWLNDGATNSDRFEFVVSNPPYINHQNLTTLPVNVQREPVLALDGGVDGLSFYRHIVASVKHVLKPGGWLFLEIGEDQGKSLYNLLTAGGSFVNIHIVKDYNQRDRIVKAQLNPSINRLN